MKKISVFLSSLLITIFTFSLVASANEQLISMKGDNPNGLLHDNLNPGEKVVEFHREIIPMNESKIPFDSVVLEESTPDNQITPFERQLTWYAMEKEYVGHSYGPWLYAGASSLSGDVLSASHSNTVSHNYSGELKVSLKNLEGLVGFNAGKSYAETVNYSSKYLPEIEGKGHRLEYRHVYKKYKVKQEKKYDKRASQVYGTAYVYPEQWVERQYRVVEFNAN